MLTVMKGWRARRDSNLSRFSRRERSASHEAKSRAKPRHPQNDGAPGEIRTPDLQLRRLPLYPAELRARSFSLHRSASGCTRCPSRAH